MRPTLFDVPLLPATASLCTALLLSACGGGGSGNSDGGSVGINARTAPEWVAALEILIDELHLLDEAEDRLDISSIIGAEETPESCPDGGSRYATKNEHHLPELARFDNCTEKYSTNEEDVWDGFISYQYTNPSAPSADQKSLNIDLTFAYSEEYASGSEQGTSTYRYTYDYQKTDSTKSYSNVSGDISFQGNYREHGKIVEKWHYGLNLSVIEFILGDSSLELNGKFSFFSKETPKISSRLVSVTTEGSLKADGDSYNLICHTGGAVILEDSQGNTLRLTFPEHDGGETTISVNGNSETFDNCDTFVDEWLDA